MNRFLEKFVFCLKLETGGLIIGWMGFLSNICTLIFLIYSAYDSGNLCNGIGILNKEGCLIFTGVYRVCLYIILIINAVNVYVYKLLIEGTKTRNHKKVRPSMILYAIGVYTNIYFLLISKDYSVLLTLGFITLIFQVYFFVVTYSLYKKFRGQRTENDRLPMVGIESGGA